MNIDKGVRDVYNCTPLHGTTTQGHLPAVKVLLSECGIDINVKDSIGATPLWWATQQRHYQVTRRLLDECDVDVNAVVECFVSDRTTPSIMQSNIEMRVLYVYFCSRKASVSISPTMVA